MRLRKVANAKQIIESSTYVINNPKDYKGKYKTLFNNENEIHIEIGMGKGDFIIEMAKHNKNINFIGIEMYDSVLVRAVQKLENQTLENLKLIRFDATYIEDIFDREIDQIYLNFSDPWPKNRCKKRRLTSKIFLKRYDKIFKNNCHIIQKTDNRKLFEFSLISYIEYDYKIKDISLNLHEDEKEIIMSEYEKRFVKMNLPIYMVEVYKTLHVK
ncbi:MAG: tRNA (guanosine(46)-N7)-methyltransferase TrmB [Bacilli bacterium]|nr:tRNA (guanosine(46)-N7)-methyltransferase TrmB [Bacilli bacterium]